MYGNCALCRRWAVLEAHHVFTGVYRKKADKYGAVIHICPDCHRGRYGVQYNRALADKLKAKFQLKIMQQQGWDRERFIQEFGKNYIREDVESC